MLIPELHETLDVLYLAIEYFQMEIVPGHLLYIDTGELAFLFSTGND
jgi:hypothetical protein